jgi:hypothetical protein
MAVDHPDAGEVDDETFCSGVADRVEDLVDQALGNRIADLTLKWDEDMVPHADNWEAITVRHLVFTFAQEDYTRREQDCFERNEQRFAAGDKLERCNYGRASVRPSSRWLGNDIRELRS